jgi:hypothetical protein
VVARLRKAGAVTPEQLFDPPGPIVLPRRGGSTVHAGGYWCEAFDCYKARKLRAPGCRVARWTEWRLRWIGDVRRPRATWILCDECMEESKNAVLNDGDLDLWLPLLTPADPYARIAVEEMLYAMAALGADNGTRKLALPLCGFDFHVTHKRPMCRVVATHVVRDWDDADLADLYLCARHVRALKRRNPDEIIKAERIP